MTLAIFLVLAICTANFIQVLRMVEIGKIQAYLDKCITCKKMLS